MPTKRFFGRPFRLLCLAAAQRIAHTSHSLSQLGELHVKADYVSTLLAEAPSLHVNRPLSVNNKMSNYQVFVEFDFNQESSDSDLSETADMILKVPVKVRCLEE